MSSKTSSIEALEERIEALIRYTEKLRLEKKEVEEKKEELARTVQDQERRIGELEKRKEELRLSAATPSSQKKEAKERIDGMIREIDHCIALLER